jgi:hypothetical protein
MPAHSRPKDGVAALAYVAGIHALATKKGVDGRDKPTTVRHEFCLRKCTALILLRFSGLRIF